MNLTDLRTQIDTTDDEIARLFKRRMEIVNQVAEVKKQSGDAVLNKNREREILSRLTQDETPETAGQLRLLFSTLFGISRNQQSAQMTRTTELSDMIRLATTGAEAFPQNAVVACQGIEGAYSQIACDKMFTFPSILYFSSFDSVFRAVDKGMCRYGILPIENSANGSVAQVYELMKLYDFFIVKSLRLRIDHCLLMRPGGKRGDIKEIVSHEQALGQCSALIESMPGVRVTVCENTAMAAKFVSESDRTDIAAISSPDCALLYNLSVVERNIQNTEHNYTRFICISKRLEIYPGACKTSVMLTISHRPGSLFDILSKLSALGLNLTKLESRPIAGRDFEFMFYLDFDTGTYTEPVLRLFDELQESLEQFKFIGSYAEM
ncbi:MAG: chorismate mutase [Christensenellaceae bacterium]|jgi:chorismate mutase/prephenate dehydratase|nr:chorismate mutase [Christensenellaceae bacterium]